MAAVVLAWLFVRFPWSLAGRGARVRPGPHPRVGRRDEGEPAAAALRRRRRRRGRARLASSRAVWAATCARGGCSRRAGGTRRGAALDVAPTASAVSALRLAGGAPRRLVGLALLWSDRQQGAIYLLFYVLPLGLLAVALARLPWRLGWVKVLYAQLAVMALVFALIGDLAVPRRGRSTGTRR